MLFFQVGNGPLNALELAMGPAVEPVLPAYPLYRGGPDAKSFCGGIDGEVETRGDLPHVQIVLPPLLWAQPPQDAGVDVGRPTADARVLSYPCEGSR